MAQYLKTDRTIVVLFSNGVAKAVNTTNPQANGILAEARKLENADEAQLLRLFDLAEAMKAYVAEAAVQCDGHKLVAANGRVTMDGEELGGVVADRILKFMGEGVSVVPLAKFLIRLMANPSFNSRQQLYSFLEALNMPITERGTFLACKYVDANYLDCFSHTFDNHIGKEVVVDRASVDDNPNNTCSKGLHVGAWEYVANSGDHRMLVEVDPADVVSVPTDYNGQKCRCCRYKVVAEITGEPPRGTFRSMAPATPPPPPAPKHVCPKCGVDVSDEPEWDVEDDTVCVCPECSIEICKECENEVTPDGANFCARCGTDLNPDD